MRRSTLMILVGLAILFSLIPLNILYRGGFCLNCLFSFLLVIIGLAVLINGIVGAVRDVKDRKDGIKDESENITTSSIIEPLFWTSDASLRILRNGRRSSAMLSGIVLSTLVIASVFIFTGVMQQDFYNDIVQTVPYETAFTLNNEGTEMDLWDLGQRIDDDDRVESFTVFGGTAPHSANGGFDWNTDSYASLEIEFPVDENISEEEARYLDFRAVPLFVRQNFSDTTIFDKMIGDGLDGSFDLDPEENRTVIPRTKANRMDLEVGDTIEVLNITITSLNARYEPEANSIRLNNVTVVGIFSDEKDDESDLFIFNTELIERSHPSFKEELERYGFFTLAVKIDPSEFDTSNMETMNEEIDRLVSDITRESNGMVSGENFVGGLVGFLSIIRYFLIVLDFIMILPTVILSIYFLIFGLDLSLEERKREVAILKVQGANTRQIFRMVSMEALILFAVGLTVGYFLSMVAAWIISSSIGFMTFDLSLSYLQEFFGYHQGALLSAGISVGIIVILAVFLKARRFINQEVSEGVQRMENKKKNIFRRFQIDLVLFFFGAISALKNISDVVFGFDSIMGVELTLGEGWDAFLFGFLGTISLWIGGALSGPPISQWISLKAEKLFLQLFFLKDVALVIKSGLRRRGDAAKLVLIIVLTLSVATLASVQGYTDQVNRERNIEYEIGADYRVVMSSQSDHSSDLGSIDGISRAMAVPSEIVIVYSRGTSIHGIDSGNSGSLEFHDDSFNDMTPDEAMKKLSGNKGDNGIIIGEDLSRETGLSEGDIFELRIPLQLTQPGTIRVAVMNVKVLGTYDHFPSISGRSSIVCDHSTIRTIRELKNDPTDAFSSDNDQPSATIYLLDREGDADRSLVRKGLDRNRDVASYRDLSKEKDEIADEVNFGIPGLLTMMFVASLIAVFTSAFAFSSIIIKRRMREFAVLQTVGASRWQIYKIAVGENALVMFVSVVMGLLVGIGLSYQMNGFFELIGSILGRGSLERVVFFPWPLILAISIAIFIGMLLAVAISAVSAARQDLAVSTRVV